MRDLDAEGQRRPQAGGLVGCEKNLLRNLWDPVQNENAGPLLKHDEKISDGDNRLLNQVQGPSEHVWGPVWLLGSHTHEARPGCEVIQSERSAISCVNRCQKDESRL